LVLHSPRRRSGLVGYFFLGISVLLALGTVFLAVTDRSVTNLDNRFSGDDSDSLQIAGQFDHLTPTATPVPQPPLLIPEDLQLTARSAFVYHPEGDTVLFERDADLPLQPASTLKVFTAMVVLDYATPNEIIEIVDSDVVDPVAESSMGLAAGDLVTVHDLLVGLMLPSGNDAANALARVIGSRIEGDADESLQDRFLREMNRVASDLGLETTELRHPAGHDREGQAVTAREMATAAMALMESPSLLTIVAMKSAEIRVGGVNPRILQVENTNELLVHEEVYGIKTGTTDQARQSLVIASREGDTTIISVILGSEDRYGDARALLQLPEPPDTDQQDEPAPEHTEPVEEPADLEN
jgi:serine-type D-Ala-D-Ala carboxypeptidase (penicillin-binding protein 5/6)